jgi:hypothetical protein
MTSRERSRHEDESDSYVAGCSNSQVLGVIETEKQRIERAPEGEVAEVARILLRSAQQEARKRGISED